MEAGINTKFALIIIIIIVIIIIRKMLLEKKLILKFGFRLRKIQLCRLQDGSRSEHSVLEVVGDKLSELVLVLYMYQVSNGRRCNN